MRITVIRDTLDADGKPRADGFEVPNLGNASISNVLQYINRHLDGSVGYYLSCRRGLCVCCVVKVDGKIETACVVAARDGMVVEPVRRDLLVKDTVVDLSMARGSYLELDRDADA